ncbi:MAG: hypothetical protein P4L87_08805 [Formivibrio sp.]|nr:hypothetical protein [Formivibrio sp.]
MLEVCGYAQGNHNHGLQAGFYILMLVGFGLFYAIGRMMSNQVWGRPQKHAPPLKMGGGVAQPTDLDVEAGQDASMTNPQK